MKLLLLLIIFILPVNALAITGPASRVDFSQGQPTVTANTSSTCNNQATARFDFTVGQPSVVYDATATCALGGTQTDIIINGTVIIHGEVILPPKQ